MRIVSLFDGISCGFRLTIKYIFGVVFSIMGAENATPRPLAGVTRRKSDQVPHFPAIKWGARGAAPPFYNTNTVIIHTAHYFVLCS